MQLTNENYYSQEANREYMSVSQFKDFAGTYGMLPCEFKALEKLNGRWKEKKTTPLLVGSYVDAYYEGTLDEFKKNTPELFKRDGGLKAEYIKADKIIERTKRDEMFSRFMSGEKQVIMTGELFGTKWKIKIDSYLAHPKFPGVVDLKVVKAVDGKEALEWVRDAGNMMWYQFWGYDIQGAIYQEIVRQNTGVMPEVYLAAVSKQDEPSIRIIHWTQKDLDQAMSIVRAQMPRVLRVKNGEAPPDRCEVCDCCRHTRILNKVINSDELLALGGAM